MFEFPRFGIYLSNPKIHEMDWRDVEDVAKSINVAMLKFFNVATHASEEDIKKIEKELKPLKQLFEKLGVCWGVSSGVRPF